MNSQSFQSCITDRFSIVCKLGNGAFGSVWKVKSLEGKEVYALKKIYDPFRDNADAQRTFREIVLLKKFRHPNIVKLYEVIKPERAATIYLLLQYMEQDLHSAIHQDSLTDQQKRFILYQICTSLKYLHGMAVAHRDLKPSNILLDHQFRIKICDFGLARLLAPQGEVACTQGIGTRWYRAPEVLLGSCRYDVGVDLWSLGCIIYEMYMRRPLFPGENTLDQIKKIIEFKGCPNRQEKLAIIGHAALSENNLLHNLQFLNSVRKPKSYYWCGNIQKQAFELLIKLLNYSSEKRIKPNEILKLEFFEEFGVEEQIPINHKDLLNIFPDSSQLWSSENYEKLISKSYLGKHPENTIGRSMMCSRKETLQLNYLGRKNSSADTISVKAELYEQFQEAIRISQFQVTRSQKISFQHNENHRGSVKKNGILKYPKQFQSKSCKRIIFQRNKLHERRYDQPLNRIKSKQIKIASKALDPIQSKQKGRSIGKKAAQISKSIDVFEFKGTTGTSLFIFDTENTWKKSKKNDLKLKTRSKQFVFHRKAELKLI